MADFAGLTFDTQELADKFEKDLKEGKHVASRWVIKDGKAKEAGSVRKALNHCVYDGAIRVDVLHLTEAVALTSYRDSLQGAPIIGGFIK